MASSQETCKYFGHYICYISVQCPISFFKKLSILIFIVLETAKRIAFSTRNPLILIGLFNIRQERKARTKRLIERGAILESLIPAPDTLTNDDVKQILLPSQAPAEYYNRSVLWNAVEKVEKAKNAQLARDIEISLPRELPFSRQKQLLIGFVSQTFVKEGMCADICIHDKLDGNPHAHIMLTMRPYYFEFVSDSLQPCIKILATM